MLFPKEVLKQIFGYEKLSQGQILRQYLLFVVIISNNLLPELVIALKNY